MTIWLWPPRGEGGFRQWHLPVSPKTCAGPHSGRGGRSSPSRIRTWMGVRATGQDPGWIRSEIGPRQVDLRSRGQRMCWLNFSPGFPTLHQREFWNSQGSGTLETWGVSLLRHGELSLINSNIWYLLCAKSRRDDQTPQVTEGTFADSLSVWLIRPQGCAASSGFQASVAFFSNSPCFTQVI